MKKEITEIADYFGYEQQKNMLIEAAPRMRRVSRNFIDESHFYKNMYRTSRRRVSRNCPTLERTAVWV